MSYGIYGAGTWTKQQKGKKLYHRYTVTVDGKRKDFYGTTKSEAMKKYKEYIQSDMRGLKKSTLTVCDVAREAIESRKGQLKATTYEFYERTILRLSRAKIGSYQIHSVNFRDCQAYINSLVDEYSMSAIKHQKAILTITFGYAEELEIIKSNPMNRVRIPNEANITHQKKEHVFLTTEERKMLEEESKRLNSKELWSGKIGTPLYGVNAKAIIFLLHTGLRTGELRALMWQDVNMSRRRVTIDKNAPTTGYEITTPKRKASYRNVPLDKVAFGIIKELSNDRNGQFIFHTEEGKMLNRNSLHRTLKVMLKRAGIDKKPTLHDLRHTYASELIRNGVDMKTVQQVLGHSDITTTMNIYVHKSDDDLDILKDVLD